ncbi:PucR family transcriptional regulator (plasmid) [Lachnospiraceae bacterium C1.1]|nr:PucR family transcriptional regulator ligand-binding domain-containing protein [Lachnospiraceae bacterium C1.1]
MGFTIEDMMTFSEEKYSMKMIAGKNGWSNSISWLIMLEELTITKNFSGKELAVTTGLGFSDENRLKKLITSLIDNNASGLIINTGFYINEIPEEICNICNENDFPLLTVPWDVYLVDMIKDISIRIFIQGSTDEEISTALIKAIENSDNKNTYKKDLLPYFDIDGTFQVMLLSTGDLDKMDTVDRKRLGYRLQLYLNNITHNGHFFYYDSCFVMVMNDVSESDTENIINGFGRKASLKMPEFKLFSGIGSRIKDIENLHIAYSRAKYAVQMAELTGTNMVNFDDMGIFRLIFSVSDKLLLREMSYDILKPLIDYDKKHDANYVETLESYLRNNGSIQAISAEMYTHRNTIIYRIKNIKAMLKDDFSEQENKTQYYLACMILKIMNIDLSDWRK